MSEQQINATENQNKNQIKPIFNSNQVDNNENIETSNSGKKRMTKTNGETGGTSAQHLKEMEENNKKLLPADVVGSNESISRESAIAAETCTRYA